MKSLYFEPMAYLDAKSFRNKAETCRSLARHITDERALRALRDLIAENTAKAEELERLADRLSLPASSTHNSAQISGGKK
jgi:hypothetical protein